MDGLAEARGLEPDQQHVAVNVIQVKPLGTRAYCTAHRGFPYHYGEYIYEGQVGKEEGQSGAFYYFFLFFPFFFRGEATRVEGGQGRTEK